MPKATSFSLPAVDFDLLYAVLAVRGNERLRLAAALVYEADLTLEDICRLIPSSFNLLGYEVGIRSAAGEVTDIAEFGEVTLSEFCAWMKVRSDVVRGGHYGPLLHDDSENALTPSGLRAEFEQTLGQLDDSGLLVRLKLDLASMAAASAASPQHWVN